MEFFETAFAWFQANKAEIFANLFAVYMAAQIIAKYTTSTKDDTILAAIKKIADLFGIWPNDPPKPVTERLIASSEEPFGSFRVRNLDRPLVRRAIRRQARLNGMPLLTEEMLDDAIAELEHEHANNYGGPLKDFLQWLLANPETILAILKIVAMLFASEKEGVS